MNIYRKIHTDTILPKEVDVVVIGGGIIGASTALELVEKGLHVALCEKGEIGAEQSSRNWGWVRRQGRTSEEIPLAILSRELWKGLEQRIGIDVGYVESGILYVASNDKEMADYENWFNKTRCFGLESRLIGASEVAALLPQSGRKFTGGLYTAQDGRAEPSEATAAIAQAGRSKGALLFQNCAVRSIETKAGRLSGVVTERGVIKCNAALIAGGIWTRLFTGNLGINFKQLAVRSTVARIEHEGPAPQLAVGGDDFAFRKRKDGGYSIAVRNGNIVELEWDHLRLAADFFPAFKKSRSDLSVHLGRKLVSSLTTMRRWRDDDITPFELKRINNSTPYGNLAEQALENLIKAVPSFTGAHVTMAWSGIIDATPDSLPVISDLPVKGLYMASGFSGHGFGISLAAGRLAAELIIGKSPCVDPSPFLFKN